MKSLPPMAKKIFLFASTFAGLEARCQWPKVTPVALNGAGCAAAPPAARTDASDKATKMPVFMSASLRLLNFLLIEHTGVPRKTELSGLRITGKPRPARPAGIARPGCQTPHSFCVIILH